MTGSNDNFTDRVLRRDSLRTRLLLWFLTVSVLPLIVVSLVGVFLTKTTTHEAARKTLSFSFHQKHDQISNYFTQLINHTLIQSELDFTIPMIDEITRTCLKSGLPLEDFIKSDAYRKITDHHKEAFRKIADLGGAYDVFLIGPDESVLYTLKKEDDLGRNIASGYLKGSLLGELILQLKSGADLGISDIGPYKISLNKPSFFIASRLNDSVIRGYLALQFDLDSLNGMLLSVNELGASSTAFILDERMRIIASSDADVPDYSLFSTIQNAMAEKQFLLLEAGKSPNLKTEFQAAEYVNHAGHKVIGLTTPMSLLSRYGQKYVLVQEVNAEEAYGATGQINMVMIILIIVILIMVIIISFVFTRRILKPINALAVWAGRVAKGDLSYLEIKTTGDEIGRVNHGFRSLVSSFREIADVAAAMALGDFEKNVAEKGPDDILGKAVNQMLDSFRSVVSQASRISEGDFTSDIKPRSSKDSLGLALHVMTRKLRDNTEEMNRQDWLKSGMADLGMRLSGEKTVYDLSHELIRFLVKYLDGQLGLIYLADEKGELILTATYAFTDRKGNFSRIQPGEGLAGQAALEREIIVFRDIQEQAPTLNYSVGEKIPSNFIIAPLEFENNLLGVIQIGKLEEFTPMQRTFIEQMLGPVAVAINTSASRTKVRQLLEQTQEQAERLQVQQEELRQTNEELEEQTKALKASEEALQAQQEELRVINEELQERSKALEEQRDDIRRKNEELIRARNEIEEKAKALETASKYKSEFLANMSHELRTPLNSIIVLSQLLAENKKENLNLKQIEYAQTIFSSGSDLLDLINEILDLSKIEAGRIEIHAETIELRDMLSQMESIFRPMIERKGLEFLLSIDDQVPSTIFTDAQRLQQILKNLLSNALKFTENGSIKLEVRRPLPGDLAIISPQGKESSMLVFTVSDTGIGIPKEKLNIIFEAFQQADGTTSRRFGGTGLGLTISRSFAQVLGGDIGLTSEEGMGSRFMLMLPEKYEAGVQPPVLVHEVSPQKSAGNEAVQITVKAMANENPGNDDRDSVNPGDRVLLVIEDDAAFAVTLYDQAVENGYKCLIAPDGESGLYLADLFAPSAIILDIGLPGINGWEVMERLRKDSRTRHIPVHFISAQDKSREAMQMGAIGYLTKPVSVEKLRDAFSRIENVISKPMKKLLVVDDDRIIQKSIISLIGNGDVTTTAVSSGTEAIEILEKEDFDCVILDLGLEDMSGYKVLEKIRENNRLAQLPVIIYTGSELTRQEEEMLQKYADSIIIKGIRSPERLLAETSLFLHRVEANLPKEKQAMIRMLYGKDDVFTGKTVLVVDDDSRNVFAITSVLEERGLKVIPASNGREGIDKLVANPDVNLILMDVMMPEMDGYEAIGLIRNMPEFLTVPIIALTAKAMKDDRDRCIEAGANDYLAKPVDSQKLLSLLRVWLYK